MAVNEKNSTTGLTDTEIVKALECCSKGVYAEVCEKCAFRNEENKINIICFNLEKYALDLINRQKAEVERLQSRNNFLEIEYKNQGNLFWERINGAKAEAYKEFAERLRFEIVNKPSEFKAVQATVDFLSGSSHRQLEILDILDNLLKELVGEQT